MGFHAVERVPGGHRVRGRAKVIWGRLFIVGDRWRVVVRPLGSPVPSSFRGSSVLQRCRPVACNGGCFCDVSTTGVNVCIKVWFAWESARGASFERRFSMGDGGLASHTRTYVVVK